MSDNNSGTTAIVAIIAIIVVVAVGYFAVTMLNGNGQGGQPGINVDLNPVNGGGQ
jgi:hypothetical protein